jgi:hypothetical protein
MKLLIDNHALWRKGSAKSGLMQVTEMRVLETNRRERDGMGISRSDGQTGNQQIMPALVYLEYLRNCWLIVLGGTPMQAWRKMSHFEGILIG